MADADRSKEHAEDVRLLAEAAQSAGAVALGFFRSTVRQWKKTDASPVSDADLAVDVHLRERLTSARPDYAWLSEETADSPERLETERVFIVDPIDGTTGFLRGSPEWTISLAVIERGRPVAAALLQPVTGTLLTAQRGAGAFIGDKRLMLDGRHSLAGARLAAPKRLLSQPELARYGLERVGFIPSLALRIAWVATGRLDAVLNNRGPYDWDVAAADLILEEAGGKVTDFSGRTLTYNARRPVHPSLSAASSALHAELTAAAAAADRALSPADA